MKNFNYFYMSTLGSPSASPNKRFLNPHRNEEERRQILKMLVTPPIAGNSKRTLSSASFDHMVIKAARSAENLQEQASGKIISPMFSIANLTDFRLEISSIYPRKKTFRKAIELRHSTIYQTDRDRHNCSFERHKSQSFLIEPSDSWWPPPTKQQ